MLGYNLAVRLSAPFSRPLPDEVARLAVKTLANIKRQNTPVVDLGNDFAGLNVSRWGYNIQSDSSRS
jgi:hypothetical protein